MEFLIYEESEGIGTLRINRPKALNALSAKLLRELDSFLNQCPVTLRALIVTGVGEKAFIAGADLKEMQSLDHLQTLDFCSLGQKVTNSLENAPFLTLAAINGYALGGGLEMALACDFIYASQEAKLGLPEVTLGIIPGFGGTQRLARAVGTRRAKEMILSGFPINAEEAYQIGLVNKVCKAEELLSEAQKTAKAISRHSQIAVRQAKLAINTGYSLGMHEALELEKNMFAVCFDTPARKEAIEAFINKNLGK